MDVLSFTDTRQNLKGVMDKVVADHAPVVITRRKAEAVVLVSLSDWNAIEETARLLSNRANAARLMDAVAQLDADGGVEHELVEA